MKITGLGHYLPEKVVLNDVFEKAHGLEAGWIESRTGIQERRWVEPGQPTSDLAVRAVDMAISHAGLDVSDIGMLIVATGTPDTVNAPIAPKVSYCLGFESTPSIDVSGSCTGFLYGLTIAEALVKAHGKSVILCAANAMSTRVSTSNIETACLFGDGAGAIIIEPSDDDFILAQSLTSKGSLSDLIAVPKGGSLRPPVEGEVVDHEYSLQLAGREVFRAAVGLMTDTAKDCLGKTGFTASDIDYWIPHQANMRIIDAVAKNIGMTAEKTLLSVQSSANTSASSIPLTLSRHYHGSEGGLWSGQKKRILLSAAGSGFLGGSILLEVGATS